MDRTGKGSRATRGIAVVSLLAMAIALAACQRGEATPGAGPMPGGDAGSASGGDASAADAMAAGTAVAGTPVPPLDTRQLQPAEIVDRGVAPQPMVAARLQVPAGWQAMGGIEWVDAYCVGNMMQVAWSAIAPDSVTAIEILPGYTWQVSGTELQTSPCPVAQYRSLREMMTATLHNVRPGAHIVEWQDMPDKVREAEQKAAANGGPMNGARVRYEAGRMLVSYARDGVAMRETMQATAMFSEMQGNVLGSVGSITASRAPSGRLDLGLVDRLSPSFQPDPQWVQLMLAKQKRIMEDHARGVHRQIDEWHNRQMALINARGAADRHAIRMRTNSEVAGIYSQIAANTSATNDTIHRRALEATGEYNTYAGAGGEPVKVSIHAGQNVFQRNDGTVFATDNPYYQPSDATQLEQVR